MIYPMMLKIDFTSIVRAAKKPKGLVIRAVAIGLLSRLRCMAFQHFLFYVIFNS